MVLSQLFSKAKSGDKLAEEEMFSRLSERFKFIARRRVEDDDAEDIAQEACVTVIEKYRAVAATINLEAWSYRVLRNKIGNYLNKKSSRRRIVMFSSENIMLDKNISIKTDYELQADLINCLKKVMFSKPQFARALNLVQLGYTTDEICVRMNVKRNHLYVILNRARNLLTKCLAGGNKIEYI